MFPNLLKLKWKDCEKEPPKRSDYYIIKYDQKQYRWFLSYYLAKERKFLMVTTKYEWAIREPQPWRWAELPRIEKEPTLFDLEIDRE